MIAWIKRAFLKTADYLFARISQPRPPIGCLKRCRLVSHRGEHDNRQVYENTLAAFDRFERAGGWGIELDVRWTRDLQPVVTHDPDFNRLFGSERKVSSMTLSELKASFKLVPTLAEVVERFGKNMHLMIEIKQEPYPKPDQQKRVMRDILSSLTPRTDYHLLALHPVLFEHFDFISADTCLPVAELNIDRMSRQVVEKKLRGLTGHFLLMTNHTIKTLQQNGQSVGTGFVDSKQCLFRELNRGVRWIFSNKALALQHELNREIQKGSR
jgi:glycerophosphoryl diester phosphodiesterase